MNEPVVAAPTTVLTPSVVVPVTDTSYIAPGDRPSSVMEVAVPARVVLDALADVAVRAHHDTSIVLGAGFRADQLTRTLVSLVWA
jgi:hypothetical protein